MVDVGHGNSNGNGNGRKFALQANFIVPAEDGEEASRKVAKFLGWMAVNGPVELVTGIERLHVSGSRYEVTEEIRHHK